MEKKDKYIEDIEENNNEINQLSLQQEYFIDQLIGANEELMNLRSENERLQNDLSIENKTNKRMMKSKERMNQLNEKSKYRHKGKVGLGYIEEGESSQQGAQKKKGLLAIIVVRQVIHQTNDRVMINQNLMESVIVATSMDIEKVNAQRNLSLKESVTIARNKDTNLQSAKPRNGTQHNKLIFGWNYKIWCRYHYCGEFGHIGENCVKHHMRKKETTKRCFMCT